MPALFLCSGNFQFLQLRDNILAGLRRIHLLVNEKDFAVRPNIKRPAVREFPVITPVILQHAVLHGNFLSGISKHREIGSFLFRESYVVFKLIYRDHEVGDIERPNLSAARTERVAFGRSPTRERLGEPGEHDRFALQLGQCVSVTVGGL